MPIVDRSSPVPAYSQIAGDIERRIDRGEWTPGDRLPSELSLAEEYGVTRVTLRQAIAQLAKDDLVEWRRGRGSFVLARRMPVVWDLNMTTGSYDAQLKSMGYQITSDVLAVGVATDVPGTISEGLRCEGPVVATVRKIYINDGAAAIHRSWFDQRTVPGLEKAKDLDRPMRAILQDKFDLVAVRSENTIEVVRATPLEAAQLGARVDSALLMVVGTSYTDVGRPLEHFNVLWMADRVRLHVTSQD